MTGKNRKKADKAGGEQAQSDINAPESSPTEQQSSAEDRSEPKQFPVVGVGASAGGLEALEGLLSQLKRGCDMAFVIVQHRAIESKSVMASLLEKYTDLKVEEVQNTTEVRSDYVYISPPHKDLTISNGKLYCHPTAEGYGPRLPIDTFFRSLAGDRGERSICIILSGTGTDGTLGLKAVKAAGGMAMVQEEEQARYPNMPRSAIDTGLVDFVLPVEKMADELMRYVKHPYIELAREPVDAEDRSENAMRQIFHLVRSATGHDFTGYKRNTIRRRIERRMAVHQVADINGYIRFLNEHPTEVGTLFKDMIITVTNFFRDPAAFDALQERVVKEIIRRKPLNSDIRIWVPGCATGEEAYSTAILFDECMKGGQKKNDIQIFATDLDASSIEVARNGVYPDSIAADVSEERLEQFFTKSGNRYKIKDNVRESLVFAVHNLIKDPPFSKLDLICCRNVLIYMGADLQQKLIPLFHHVLNSDGFLFLGTSETVGSFSDLFSAVDAKMKIFKRQPRVDPRPDHFAIPWTVESGANKAAYPPLERGEKDTSRLVEKLILREYSLPCVLVNKQYEIIYFNGDTITFLAQPGGAPTTNVLKMARPELHHPLSIVLHQAEREQRTVESKILHIQKDSDLLPLRLIVRPIRRPNGQEALYLVIFHMMPDSEAPTDEGEREDRVESGAEPRLKALEQELASTQEYLRTTIEELETSNEELKSSNEELQSTNEELQSTNEELETSREELQSTNEELRTVNFEHQARIDELAQVNDELSDLLASTNVATIFLDRDLKIKRFTNESKSIFKIMDGDTGRPLDYIVNKLEYEDLAIDAKQVLDSLNRIEREVKTKDEAWLRLRILPYRTTENIIDGVAITAFDITSEKAAQHFAESIVETVRQPLVVLDEDLKIISANPAFYRSFKVTPDHTVGKFMYHLGNRQWDIPKLRKLLEEILPDNSCIEDFEVEHDFPGIGRRKMILNGRRVVEQGMRARRILLAIEDVTPEP